MAPVRRPAIPPAAASAAADAAPERHLKALLQTVTAAMRGGDMERALRHADRAWRQARDDAALAHLYGRLLAHVGEHQAAVRLLTQAAAAASDPELEAQIVECLLARGDTAAAAARLAQALRSFCLEPGGALALSARRVAERAAPAPSG
ncbi:MAG TPA: hypothetical protein VFA22_00875, partial [Stellaceae bacterium]|nr:hypothetical protein [Stellaceae bacterium]